MQAGFGCVLCCEYLLKARGREKGYCDTRAVTGWDGKVISASPVPCRRGRWGLGERAVLRVPHSAVQGCSQPAGALPDEQELRAHRQVVRQAL